MNTDAIASLDSLNRDGFVVLHTKLAELCDAAVSEFREIEAGHPNLFKRELDGRYPRLINFHLASPALRRLYAENHTALAVQDAFFGEPSSLYTTLMYEKGSAQDLHRDTPYFTTRPEHKYLGVWVAMEDVDETNGPLMVLPGGHLMPEEDREAIAASVFPDGQIPDNSDELWIAYQTLVAQSGERHGLTRRTVPIKKGETIIWHPQLPHGGSPILDPERTRLSLVQHVTPKKYQVYGLDAFFKPHKTLPTEGTWTYAEMSGRSFVDHGVVGIGHHLTVNTETLTLPQTDS